MAHSTLTQDFLAYKRAKRATADIPPFAITAHYLHARLLVYMWEDIASRFRTDNSEGPLTQAIFHAIFHAILRTKPAPAYLERILNRTTLRQNTTKLV